MKKWFLSVLFGICVLLMGLPVLAGQALYMNEQGTPLYWDKSAADPILIHPEAGACGQYSNDEMVSLIATNLDEWAGIAYVDLDFSVVEGTVSGVDYCNYDEYLAGVIGVSSTENTQNIQDSINPVLFDNDGNIVDYATGENNGRYVILGFASPDGFTLNAGGTDYEKIVDGQAVFNCYCLDDGSGNPAHDDCNDVSTIFTTDDLDFTMIHEIGHMLNLDHSQLNHDYRSSNPEYLPTMFPASYDAANQKTPMLDDQIALASIYPKTGFFTASSSSSSFCKVTGTLLDRFSQDLRCADVQFVSDTATSSVSFVSGSYAQASDTSGDGYTDGTGECTGNCGDFVFYLTPGASYTFTVKPIYGSYIGGSSVGPCASAQLSECTPAMITGCTDDSTSTSCTACIKSETITTNHAGTTIATKIASECVAGATVALGDIDTSSVSKTSSATETLKMPFLTHFGGPSDIPFAKVLANTEGRFAGKFQSVSCPESGGDPDGDDAASSSGSMCAFHRDAKPVKSDGTMVKLGALGFVFLVWYRQKRREERV